MQEKSNGKNAKFPAARIVDGVVKSIIVEKVIHTKFIAYRDQRFISQVLYKLKWIMYLMKAFFVLWSVHIKKSIHIKVI